MTEPRQYPEPSRATSAVLLGIIGLLTCGVLSPYAWYLGSKEIKAINEDRRDPTNRGSANAARVIGIIGTVILVIALGVLALLLV